MLNSTKLKAAELLVFGSPRPNQAKISRADFRTPFPCSRGPRSVCLRFGAAARRFGPKQTFEQKRDSPCRCPSALGGDARARATNIRPPSASNCSSPAICFPSLASRPCPPRPLTGPSTKARAPSPPTPPATATPPRSARASRGKPATSAHMRSASPAPSSGVATATGPVVNTAGSFTASAWVNFAALGGYQTVVSIAGTNVAGFFLQLRGDTGTFAFTRLSSDAVGGATFVSSSDCPRRRHLVSHCRCRRCECRHIVAVRRRPAHRQHAVLRRLGRWRKHAHRSRVLRRQPGRLRQRLDRRRRAFLFGTLGRPSRRPRPARRLFL